MHDTSGRTGVANDERSKSDAIAKATNTCTADGSSHCKVMISFRNTCVAYATGDSGYNTAFTNPSEDTAKRDALSDCKGRDTGCEVIYSACSVPVRVR
ncbi:DUF4189 domain-containing protein [Bacillus sp. NP157]|nr:DUF4189 domain-containing protein [Bacillus sp. NP157]